MRLGFGFYLHPSLFWCPVSPHWIRGSSSMVPNCGAATKKTVSSHFDKIVDDDIYAQHAHTRLWCGYRTPKQSWVKIESEAQPHLLEPSTTPSHVPTTPERPRRDKRVQESAIPTGSPVLIPNKQQKTNTNSNTNTNTNNQTQNKS
jgi:hypothetical protein